MRSPVVAPRCAMVCFAAVCVLRGLGAEGTELPSGIEVWLARQTSITTWQATVSQTRRLQSLAQPLVTTGRVWFQAPGEFRWELGDPPKTIAARHGDQLILLYPALKRAELYPLAGDSHDAWRGSLALLEAGFPRSARDLNERFHLRSVTSVGPRLEILLAPRSAAARRWMPRIQVTLATNDLSLQATELSFTDGSQLRNVFTNTVLNPPVDPTLFHPVVPPDYQVIKPAAR